MLHMRHVSLPSFTRKKPFDWINVPLYIFSEREKLFQNSSIAVLVSRPSMEDASFALTPLQFVILYMIST